MQYVLISYGQLLFFISLLVLYDEVVEENFIQFVEGFFNGYAYSLFC